MTKVAVAAAYGATVAPLFVWGTASQLFWIAAGSAYYAAVSVAAFRTSSWVQSRTVTPGAVFVFLAFAFLLLPALVLPGIASMTFLVWGWDLTLSSYSLCVEAARASRKPSLIDSQFFILVNPALVFVDRGGRTGDAGFNGRGLARVLLGFGALFLSTTAFRPAAQFAAGDALALGFFPNRTFALAAFALLRFLAEYGGHSGLASVQIGLLRQVGYRAPERYHYPFLAKNPVDFWRRWNIYVGTWLKLYVFLPAARAARSRHPGRRSLFLPVFLAAAASAALHDGYVYLTAFEFHTTYTEFFATAFAAVVVWALLERASRWLFERHHHARPDWLIEGGAMLSRLCLFLGLMAAAVAWG